MVRRRFGPDVVELGIFTRGLGFIGDNTTLANCAYDFHDLYRHLLSTLTTVPYIHASANLLLLPFAGYPSSLRLWSRGERHNLFLALTRKPLDGRFIWIIVCVRVLVCM